MIRVTTLLWIALLVIAGGTVMHVSYQVRHVEKHLSELARDTPGQEQDAIRILSAEWDTSNQTPSESTGWPSGIWRWNRHRSRGWSFWRRSCFRPFGRTFPRSNFRPRPPKRPKTAKQATMTIRLAPARPDIRQSAAACCPPGIDRRRRRGGGPPRRAEIAGRRRPFPGAAERR